MSESGQDRHAPNPLVTRQRWEILSQTQKSRACAEPPPRGGPDHSRSLFRLLARFAPNFCCKSPTPINSLFRTRKKPDSLLCRRLERIPIGSTPKINDRASRGVRHGFAPPLRFAVALEDSRYPDAGVAFSTQHSRGSKKFFIKGDSMKDKKSEVLVSRSELAAYCDAHAETFGYDAMRDWLYKYAETAKLSDEAASYYRMMMTAY